MVKNKWIKSIFLFLFLLLLFLWGCNNAPPINHAPSITSIPQTNATVNLPYEYNVEAVDPDGDNLTYSLTTHPSGMTINPDTGIINWTPINPGTENVITQVSDGKLFITQSFNINVISDSNQPPTASFSADPSSGEAPLEVSFDAGGSLDPDGSITDYHWDFGDGSTGNGVTITHTFTSTGSHTITLTVSDNEGTTVNTSQNIMVTGDDSLPVIVSFNPSAPTITQGESVTLSWEVTNANVIYISPTVGDVSTTPTGSAILTPAGTTSYTLTASNGNGSVMDIFMITVNPPDDGQPQTIPVIDSFTSNYYSLIEGKDQSAVLSWQVTDAVTVTLNPDIGVVAPADSIEVSPTKTTTYTLSASNSQGINSSQLSITIIPAGWDPLNGNGWDFIMEYTIVASAGEGGQINPSGNILVAEGDSWTFTITPNECYRIDDVLVDGNSIGKNFYHTFTYIFSDIYEDHSISATFKAIGIYNEDTKVSYQTIQDAIDAALSGKTIVLCSGVYYENIVLDNKDITIRSTKPDDADVVAATIIDGGKKDSVVKCLNADTSTIKGLTIRNGDHFNGGGIYIESSLSNITGNNIIQNNADNHGGGIFVSFSYNNQSSNITGNTITVNNADKSGGGIFVTNGANPNISENNIISNWTGVSGGGIFANNSSSPAIVNNTITDNESMGAGGGVTVYESSATIIDNLIGQNTAKNQGGGINVDGSSVTIDDNRIEYNSVIRPLGDATYEDGAMGGGIFVRNSYTSIKNNVLLGNTATKYGGGIYAVSNYYLLPDTQRPSGWGSSEDPDYKQKIPKDDSKPAEPLLGPAGNTFSGNRHGTPLDYTKGAHAYFYN